MDAERAKQILPEEAFEVRVELGLGGESGKCWTCDFGDVSTAVCE